MFQLKLRRNWVAQEERICQGKVGSHSSLGGAFPWVSLAAVAPSRTLETINHSQGFVKTLAL